jgi:hypothetical protein
LEWKLQTTTNPDSELGRVHGLTRWTDTFVECSSLAQEKLYRQSYAVLHSTPSIG